MDTNPFCFPFSPSQSSSLSELPSSSSGQHGVPRFCISQNSHSMDHLLLKPLSLPTHHRFHSLMPPGSHHGWHRDCGFPSVTAFRTHVPHLPGHAEEYNDHQGVPPPILLRLYRHGPSERVTGGMCLRWDEGYRVGASMPRQLTVQSLLSSMPGTRSALPAARSWYPSGLCGRTPTLMP